MRKTLFLCLCLLYLLPAGAAAQSQTLSLTDAVTKAGALSPENRMRMGWLAGTDSYVWVDRTAGQKMMAAQAATGAETTLFTLDEINAALKGNGFKELSSLGMVQFSGPNTCWFDAGGKICSWDIAARKLTMHMKYPADIAENAEYAGTQQVAWTQENNVYTWHSTKGVDQITFEQDKGVVCGRAAHRNEFGINKGMFWSANAKKLAYYRVDERKVTEYPILGLDETPSTVRMIRYPMAGQTSHFATVGVYDATAGAIRYLKSPNAEADHYYACITWAPDEKHLLVAELNRDQNDMALNLYNGETGEWVKELFREKHEKFVEPKYDPYFLPGRPTEFIWQSQRDGYNHMYHYNLNGDLLGQLTTGNWIVTQILGMSQDGKTLFFGCTDNQGLERHACALDLKSRKITRLTQGKGVHNVVLSPRGNYLIDNYTSSTVPRVISILDAKGKVVREVLRAANPLAAYKLGEMRLFTVKADDGTDLWCRMFLPPGFDPSRKYPVLDYVYGGPGVQLITDTWLGGAPLWFHYAAQQGYVVFTLENRGSANRGRDFEQATFRNLGTVELRDQMKGVEYLKSQPWVDQNRMAIHGWSYGGFMTTSLMLRYPGTFQVGIAGGPVIDWRMYEVMYTERYMDTPETNPEGYKTADLLNYVKDLKGKLLLIHGTSDDVVVWQHSLKVLEKSVETGTEIDYFVYPMHEHNVVGPDRLHLIRKIMTYVDEHLK